MCNIIYISHYEQNKFPSYNVPKISHTYMGYIYQNHFLYDDIVYTHHIYDLYCKFPHYLPHTYNNIYIYIIPSFFNVKNENRNKNNNMFCLNNCLIYMFNNLQSNYKFL